VRPGGYEVAAELGTRFILIAETVHSIQHQQHPILLGALRFAALSSLFSCPDLFTGRRECYASVQQHLLSVARV